MVYLEIADADRLKSEISKSSRPQTLACVGIDDFEAFKRQFGFELGDQVLSHLESVAKEVLTPALLLQSPDSALIAIVDGDADNTLTLVERLRSRVGGSKLRFTVDGNAIARTVTISAGITKILDRHDPVSALQSATEAWIAARHRANTVVRHESRDQATGLLTGHSLEETLGSNVAQGTAESPFSLLSWDLDAFGKLNRDFGREAADELLELVAGRLNDAFGETGFVGRLWADEFLVGLPNVRAEDAAFEAESLRRNLTSDAISLSIGLATAPIHSPDPRELLRKAREARYASQIKGGGCVSVAEADQMVTKTSHFSRVQLQRLAKLAKVQDRSEAALLREGLDGILQVYEDSAPHTIGLRTS